VLYSYEDGELESLFYVFPFVCELTLADSGGLQRSPRLPSCI